MESIKFFYSENFGVFKVNTGEIESIAQFQLALNIVGIEMIFASSLQAKGRVARANLTL